MSFLQIPSATAPVTAIDDPAIHYTFPLDLWQQQAVSAIHKGHNVLVTAKTGSGKTLVGEYQIAFSLRQGKRVFYTTPIKSLSNQKYHDLKHLFPRNTVGIMTGDIKSNPEADIVVMTTEILRNLLFKQNTTTATLGTAGQMSLENLGAVVFDEVHYINDPDRGHVWEETLILLPPDVKLILLSATIDSPELFAEWLGTAKQRPIVLLKTTHRIVPLVHGIYDPAVAPLPLRPLKTGDEAPYQSGTYPEWLRHKEAKAKSADEWRHTVRAANTTGASVAGSTDKVKLQSFTHTLNECVEQLQHKDLLPALFFVFSRKECERYADQLTGSLIDSSDTASVKHIISFHLHKYKETLEHLPQYHQITRLLERGIAFHHSGLLPLLKEIVELLFSRGFIKVLFCTETFAVGLNMPARTVVFLDLKKPHDGDGFRPLRPDEYIQMAGRAGRRGKDTQGIVMYMPSRKPVEPDELRGIFTGALVPLESRLQFHYDFILKALHSSTATKSVWNAVIDASYWSEQRRRAIVAVEEELVQLEARRATIPLSEDMLLELDKEKAMEIKMKQAVNAAKNRAAQELNQWRDRHRGPTWTTAKAHYVKYTECTQALQKLQQSRKDMDYSVEEHRVQPIMDALRAWGAFQESTTTLSPFGVLATEFNEGNALLLAKLYESQLLKGATLPEIVAVLGAFLVDRESQDKSVHPRALKLSERVINTLIQIDTWGQEGYKIDKTCGVESPDDYWSLATLWTQIGYEWVQGENARTISEKYEIYEGNLTRGLLKLTSLVNEWITAATYKADVDMLETMKGAQSGMLRDIVQPESLYLRL